VQGADNGTKNINVEYSKMTISRRIILAGVAVLAMSVSASAADMIGNCELAGTKGSIPIEKTANPGQLTVQVSLPAPVWWNGETADSIKDGMEYCMAAEIAWRAGYDKLKVVAVDWTPLITGKTSGYDLTLSEISITDARKEFVDFSVPYFSSDIGVLTRADKPVDQKSIREVTVGLQQGTTGAGYATETLGLTNINVYAERHDLFKALHDGEVDAVVTDTSITLSQEVSDGGRTKVAGQYKTGETYGAVYEKGSPNGATIDKIIKAIIEDGTMKKLSAKYLASAWGKDPASIPYFNP
jgi:polar amino acid transport system substrate-binding protein